MDVSKPSNSGGMKWRRWLATVGGSHGAMTSQKGPWTVGKLPYLLYMYAMMAMTVCR